MTLSNIRDISRRLNAPDDPLLSLVRNNMAKGMDSRTHPTKLGENQGELFSNISLDNLGERKKRPGSVLIGDDVGDVSPVTLKNYEIQGATDQFLMWENKTLWKWTGGASWSALATFPAQSTDVGIAIGKQSGLAPDDIALVQTDQGDQFTVQSDGTIASMSSASVVPAATTVMTWYGNRFWTLKNDLLEYSDAYSSDYANAFGNADFRIPVGEERAIVPTRDLGMIIFGAQAVWALAPSATPAATDKPEPIITAYGAVSKKGIVSVGDDIYFFAPDGLRSLQRTVQDKLQVGASFPLSYRMQDEFAEISWANISNLTMEYFDNKIFISVPLTSTTYKTWIYYPALDAFVVMEDIQPTVWGKYKISGEERLYYGKQGQGKVYRAWNGFTDEGTTTTNGTAVTSQEDGREEDFGQPQVFKEGGEVEVEAVAAGGAYSLTISARIDGGAYSTLGTMDLESSTAPTLPVDLPFNLSDAFIIRKKFSLDQLGVFRTLQIRWTNSDTTTEDVVVQSINYATIPLPYDRG